MKKSPAARPQGKKTFQENGRILLEVRVRRDAPSERLGEVVAGLLAAAETGRSLDLRITKTKIRRLIMAGSVRVDGRTVRQPAWEVRPGQVVAADLDVGLFTAEKDPGDLSWEMGPGDILFEDSWILVVNKPAGLPTEGTVVASRDSLHSAALRYLARRGGHGEGEAPYLGLHHRLDKETSGVLLFTKKREANKAVHEMFLRHEAEKTYLALTEVSRKNSPAVVAGRSFRVENRLGRISPKSAPGKWGPTDQGDWAATDFTLLERAGEVFLWEARPQTGRTHQIRVHLSGLGFPLLGDSLYGGRPSLGTVKVPRIMLHALRLTFPHPETGERTTVQAPLPADFQSLLPPRRKGVGTGIILESPGEIC